MKNVIKISNIIMAEYIRKNTGFTLVELLFTFGILSIYLCGILVTYINMLILSDLSRDITLATNAAQAKIEEMQKTPFANLPAFDRTSFNIQGFTAANAKGVIYVADTSYSDLERVKVVVCFKSRLRVIGGDRNLNGALDAGEANINNELVSPVELVTLIAK